MYVAVVGPNEASDAETAVATEVGRLLAARGCLVVTGGLGGVMAAATTGAEQAGGLTVGFQPGDARDPVSEADVVIATGLGQLRNLLVVNSADAVIAVGGSWGTLSEIAYASRVGKPVVCIGGWSLTDADGVPIPLETATSADDAVDYVVGAKPA